MTLFLVAKRDLKKGQIRTKRIDDVSMRALGSNEVFLDDVYVPSENIFGEKDKGWNLLPQLLNAERISTASMSVGVGELALEKACSYAKERKVFGRPIGSNQAIQFPQARSKADLEASWAITQQAAWRDVCKGQRSPEEYWNEFAKSGLFGLLVGAEWSGMGKSFLNLTLAV